MSIDELLFSYASAGIFISMILHVAFGQITVRKLRKNPKTKDVLGMEFISGWDVFHVADALSRPKWMTKKIKKSTFSSLVADAEILYKHTTLFDRILARILFWLSSVSTILLTIIACLGSFGFLE